MGLMAAQDFPGREERTRRGQEEDKKRPMYDSNMFRVHQSFHHG